MLSSGGKWADWGEMSCELRSRYSSNSHSHSTLPGSPDRDNSGVAPGRAWLLAGGGRLVCPVTASQHASHLAGIHPSSPPTNVQYTDSVSRRCRSGEICAQTLPSAPRVPPHHTGIILHKSILNQQKIIGLNRDCRGRYNGLY